MHEVVGIYPALRFLDATMKKFCKLAGMRSRNIMNHNGIRIALCAVILGLVVAVFGFLQPVAVAQGGAGYHVVKTLPVGGDEGWDYVAVDSTGRRVYVSHGTHVVVLDADSGAVAGDIPDTPGVHGIAIASNVGRGFVSSGRANSVTIFDLKTLKTLGTV